MADAFSIAGLNTEADLCRVYDAWLADRGYTPMSADELYYELLAAEPCPENDLLWLAGFSQRWDQVMYPEQKSPLDSMWDRTTLDPDYGDGDGDA